MPTATPSRTAPAVTGEGTGESREEAVTRLLEVALRLNTSLRARSRAWFAQGERLGRGDLAVLGTIAVRGSCRASEIAAAVEVGAPVVSRHLATLEERGLVRREADPDDRRAEQISLTEHGRSRLEQARTALCGQLAEHVSEWDTAQVLRTAASLEELVAALTHPDL